MTTAAKSSDNSPRAQFVRQVVAETIGGLIARGTPAEEAIDTALDIAEQAAEKLFPE